MTIGPGHGQLPEHAGRESDDPSASCDNRHRMDQVRPHPLYSLTDRTLASSGRTRRALAFIVVIAGVIIMGMWLLDIEVTIGPVHIGR